MTELLTCDGNLFQIKNCHSDNVTTQFCSPSTFFFANTLYKCFKRGNDIYCSCLVLDWLINHNSINKITITRTEKKINCIKLHHNIHVINHIFFIRCMQTISYKGGTDDATEFIPAYFYTHENSIILRHWITRMILIFIITFFIIFYYTVYPSVLNHQEYKSLNC